MRLLTPTENRRLNELIGFLGVICYHCWIVDVFLGYPLLSCPLLRLSTVLGVLAALWLAFMKAEADRARRIRKPDWLVDNCDRLGNGMSAVDDLFDKVQLRITSRRGPDR